MSTITYGNFPQSTTRTARPVRTASPRPAGSQLRLTGRGKAVVLSLAVAVIGLVAIVLGPSSTATDEIGTPQETTTVRVLAGHTLWKIAAEANPDGDIRSTVDEIIELNALPNASALQMGSEIAVPVYE
ncbi:MAG: LysM domain-containing protein [Aeromicrobium sp.]